VVFPDGGLFGSSKAHQDLGELLVEKHKLEGVLKRDPALTYKLLRNINSAGFGAGREVQSIRQAISLMGYAPLYRWLTLLLAGASASGYSPVLMETAVVRGRLTELLGLHALPKGEAENLFVAGMFSLLDRLLGLPMKEVLETIPLPPEVVRALLAREGVYGPYPARAEACHLIPNRGRPPAGSRACPRTWSGGRRTRRRAPGAGRCRSCRPGRRLQRPVAWGARSNSRRPRSPAPAAGSPRRSRRGVSSTRGRWAAARRIRRRRPPRRWRPGKTRRCGASRRPPPRG